MEIKYKPTFLRSFKRLPLELQTEAREKILLFQDEENHQKLRVHKLKGRLEDFYSFSVSYSHRIVFVKESKNTVVFLEVGDHGVYK